MAQWMGYWYHFAIMFEALFILTTIDTGTRVARYILQEMVKYASPRSRWAKVNWMPSTIVTSAIVTFAWGYMVYQGEISTIWPMFGVANQLLSALALSFGTVYILGHTKKWQYALITFLPSLFMFATTAAASFDNIFQNYLPQHSFKGNLNALLSALMLALVVIIFIESGRKGLTLLRKFHLERHSTILLSKT